MMANPSLPVDAKAVIPPLIEALMNARCYPHAVNHVERIDTHISWVLLAGEFAYKIKKPVALGFLDFSTLAARRYFCAEELRLNRATAPRLYLDVIPITGSAADPRFDGDGPVIEYALKMRRFEQHELLDQYAQRGELDAGLIDRLAAGVAAFHAQAAVAAPAAAYGTPANITQPALDNFVQIAALAPPAADAARLNLLQAWTAAASNRLAATFNARKANGRVRECHGDLHLGNIAMIDGVPTPFDCIEFNPGFRWIDVISELAFLVMDLLDRELDALAWRCLNRYLEISGDYEGVDVLRYYLVYRAMVRAKVALIHARQPVAGSVRRVDESSFSRHVQLAQRLTAPAPAALILMHGLSGSGKTTVSQLLLETLGGIRIRSDVERKRLHGLAADRRSAGSFGDHIYSTDASQNTYQKLATLAALVLRAGWPVIIDAASLRRHQRELFREVCKALARPFLLLSCAAAEPLLKLRLERRNADARDASDADFAVLQHQLETQELPADDELCTTIVHDGGADASNVINRVFSQLNKTS